MRGGLAAQIGASRLFSTQKTTISDVVFVVEEAPEGGYIATAVGGPEAIPARSLRPPASR
jgi:hypothetical protein